MKLLETINLDNKEYSIYYSDHVALRDVLSLILRNYAQQLEKKFIVPSLIWHKMNEAKVVYVVDESQKVVGGVSFIFDTEFNMASISLIFSEGAFYTKEMHGYCLNHCKAIAKNNGMSIISQHIHLENNTDLELAKHVGLEPKFYLLTRSLVENDQE